MATVKMSELESVSSINSESTVNVSLATTENNATRIVNVILIGEWK